MTTNELVSRFTYHAPNEDQPKHYEEIRRMGLTLATVVCAACPESRERSLALTKIEEAVMWANAAIARSSDA